MMRITPEYLERLILEARESGASEEEIKELEDYLEQIKKQSNEDCSERIKSHRTEDFSGLTPIQLNKPTE